MLNKILLFLHLYCLCGLYDEVSARKYTIMNQNLSYFDAVLSCKRAGKNLVSIETVDEWKLLTDLLDNSGYGNRTGNLLWTSGSSLNEPHSGNFFWTSNASPIDSEFWSPTQPDDANTDTNNNEYCVNIQHYNGKYGINDYNCYKEIGYVCEATEASAYSVVREKVNYFEAALACQRNGSELASIDTEEEWQDVVSLLKNSGFGDDAGNVLWTSGNSLNGPHSKQFFWMSDGRAIANDAVYWSTNQPDDANDGEFCVNVRIVAGAYGLNDYDCYNKIGYICESKIAIDFVDNVRVE